MEVHMRNLILLQFSQSMVQDVNTVYDLYLYFGPTVW